MCIYIYIRDAQKVNNFAKNYQEKLVGCTFKLGSKGE